MRTIRIAVIAALATLVAALTLPAGAATTTVTGLLGTSVSISTPPAATVDFGTFTPGANVASGGTLAVSANAAYVVTVVADQTAMTAYSGGAYGAGKLTTPLALAATPAGGVPVTTPVAAIGTSAQTFMTGTGVTADSATISLTQTVLPNDAPASYRTVLTYTASPAL